VQQEKGKIGWELVLTGRRILKKEDKKFEKMSGGTTIFGINLSWVGYLPNKRTTEKLGSERGVGLQTGDLKRLHLKITKTDTSEGTGSPHHTV